MAYEDIEAWRKIMEAEEAEQKAYDEACEKSAEEAAEIDLSPYYTKAETSSCAELVSAFESAGSDLASYVDRQVSSKVDAGEARLAIGPSAVSTGDGSSIALGEGAKATGKYAVAVGYGADVSASSSGAAFGAGAKASALGAVRLGLGNNTKRKSLQFRGANLFYMSDGSDTVAVLGPGFPAASQSAPGAMSKEDKAKLDGIDAALSTKADLSAVPTKTSQLSNDSGYLTAHQDLSEYAKVSAVPTRTSDLINDSGYLTAHQSLSDYAKLNKVVPLSGAADVGPLALSGDFSAPRAGVTAPGNSVTFNGGQENFAVGHDHVFFGKESFALHDGNRVGAKGFYWKAIDTTGKKIYLTKTQPQPDVNALPVSATVHDLYVSDHPEYDSPYFGPRSDSLLTGLFEPEDGIGLRNKELSGKYITVVNKAHDKFWRCFKVLSVDAGGSVITYEDARELGDYARTFYRKKSGKAPDGSLSVADYSDNEHVVFFPEMDQKKITCAEGSWVTPTSFGCAALGDGNHVMGFDSFAAGSENRVEGNYSAAIGWSSKAEGNTSYAIGNLNDAKGINSMALGYRASAGAHRAFAWNGAALSVGRYNVEKPGAFGINPADGISGFYIGDTSLAQVLAPLLDRIAELESRVTELETS